MLEIVSFNWWLDRVERDGAKMAPFLAVAIAVRTSLSCISSRKNDDKRPPKNLFTTTMSGADTKLIPHEISWYFQNKNSNETWSITKSLQICLLFSCVGVSFMNICLSKFNFKFMNESFIFLFVEHVVTCVVPSKWSVVLFLFHVYYLACLSMVSDMSGIFICTKQGIFCLNPQLHEGTW